MFAVSIIFQIPITRCHANLALPFFFSFFILLKNNINPTRTDPRLTACKPVILRFLRAQI